MCEILHILVVCPPPQFFFTPATHALIHPSAITFARSIFYWEQSGWSFSCRDAKSSFSPRQAEIWTQCDHRRWFHCLLLCLIWAWAQKMHPFFCTQLMYRFFLQVAIRDAARDCAKWQQFSKVLLSRCGYINQSMMALWHEEKNTMLYTTAI